MLFNRIFGVIFALLVGIATAVPEFVETFDVGTAGPREYRQFLERLRDRVRDPDNGSRGLPICLPQVVPPTRWFEIVLRAGNAAIRLWMQRDNFWVIGYRNEATPNQWFELVDNNAAGTTIPGATRLGWGGDYNAMQGGARTRRETINLGQNALATAVQTLPGLQPPQGDNPDLRARHMMIIVQMISEAARFRYIGDEIFNNWRNGGVPSARTLGLENAWGALSEELLRADNNAEQYRLALPTVTQNQLQLHNLAEIIAVIGILLRGRPDRGAGSNSKLRREARMDVAKRTEYKRQEKALVVPGRQLMEVFHVVVNNIDNENPGDLYGSITVTEAYQSYYIYNRDRSNDESISPGGYPTLTGPARAINAADYWQMDFNLMDKDVDLSPDDEVAKGIISWSPHNWREVVYDKAISTTVSGKNGNVGIVYAVMSNAAEALIEVNMLNGDGENPADVYGSIKAKTSAYDNEIILFNKEENQHIDVRPSENIPLLRVAVAVPLDATLTITADLKDHDDDLSFDDEIAKGIAEFKPDIQKSSTQRIKGKYGEVEVRISWL